MKKKKLVRDFLLFLILAMFLVTIYYLYVPTTVEGYSMAQVLNLPFASGSLKVADTSLTGVTVYNKEKSYEGYNFHTGKLMDMEGNLVRNWSAAYLGIILDDGTYVGQKELPEPLVGRYTFDDEVLWEKAILTHHEIIKSPDDTLLMFGKDVINYQGRKVEFDTILEFDLNGKFISKYSTWKNFDSLHKFHDKLQLDKPFSYIIPKENRMNQSLWGGDYDYYHLNTLNFVPPNDKEGKHRAFNPGNWILTMRHGSLVFILDKDTKEVLWYWGKELQGPHSSKMLQNGNLLIFDNGRYRNWSRVIEVDPVNLEIVWEYKADDFYSLTRGHVQELPNGNLLISETDDGHVIEITRDKEIVWEYWNPIFNNESKRKVTFNLKITRNKGVLFDFMVPNRNNREVIYRTTRYPKAMIDNFINS